jgi:uncharacterized protein (TIGR03067 family)
MTRCILAIVAAAMAAAADAPKDEASRELAKLQGAWNVVAVEVNGERLPAEKTRDGKLIIKGNKYQFHVGKERIEGTYRLEPGHKPKAIDATRTNGPDKGKTLLGIYEQDGNHLKMCFAEPGKKQRPGSFITKKDAGLRMYVLERAK